MQTPSILPAAPSVSGPKQNGASAGESAMPFNQVLSQEVAQRKTPETRGPESKQDKPAAQEHRSSNGATSAGEAKQAEGKPTEGEDTAEQDPAQATDASQAPSDLLALVANVAQLQKTEGEVEVEADSTAGTEDALDAAGSGRKGVSPFAAIHAAIGARANHGTQIRPEGTWAAQAERATSSGMELGKGVQAVQVQTAAVRGTDSKAAAASDFASSLKDAGQVLQPLSQAAAAQLEQAAPAQPGADRLAPRVGTPAWDQALGQKIVWMVNGEQQNASLTLNPPELGPLKVVLQVSNMQASATFVAAQPEVRQALEAAMPRLREMLGESGIQLGQATVDSGSPHQQHAEDRWSSRARGMTGSGDSAEAQATAVSGTRALPAAGRGMIDTFA